MLFSWLIEKGVLAMNPAREVKTERFSRTEGKTPAFVEGEVQRLLNTVETSTHTGLRDRALLGTLAYTFARIGAVVNLKVGDYYPSGKRFLLHFKEKGGKEIIARGFSLTTSTEHPDGSLLVERRKICDGWSRVANEWILIKESQTRSFHFEHTTYSGRELKDRLIGAGFADVKLFGDLAGRPYDWEAKRLVIKSNKA
jgi:hypothetical protein